MAAVPAPPGGSQANRVATRLATRLATRRQLLYNPPMNSAENYNVLRGLNPPDVWRHFADIAAIPRCSCQEDAVREHVIHRAVEWGLEHQVDSAGNVVVRRPAAPRRESAPSVVLQGHLDMVCEKNMGVDHDFARQGISLRRDGDWLRAVDTTLGADNGIAVAMMLALLEGVTPVGPLECLFTVDEESGLTGAKKLDPSLVRSGILINLDSEEEGFFCIGCAGGLNTYITLPVVRTTPDADDTALDIMVAGLKGGHSGAEIHLERASSIVVGARLMTAVMRDIPEARIAAIEGGGKHNAIPRELLMRIVVPADARDRLEKTVVRVEEILQDEYRERDPGLRITVTPADLPEFTLTVTVTSTVVSLLSALPHGVLGMSATVPGLVETSTNIAAVRLDTDGVHILTSQRSSREALIDFAGERVAAPARLAGGAVRHGERYPAWPPARHSRIVDTAAGEYRRLTGKEPEIGAFHAGLECGVIRDRVGEMDMVSFGPDLVSPHTPEERLNIPSTERTWYLLVATLQAL